MQLWLMIMFAMLAISQLFGGSSTDASPGCKVTCEDEEVETVKMPTNGKGGEVLTLEQFNEHVVNKSWVAVYDLVSDNPVKLHHMYRWAGHYSEPDSNGNYSVEFERSVDRNDATCVQLNAEYRPLGNDDWAVFDIVVNNTAGQDFEMLLSSCPVKYLWRFMCSNYTSNNVLESKKCPRDQTYLQLIVKDNKDNSTRTGMDDLPWASIEKDLDDNAGTHVKGFCRQQMMESHFLLLGDCEEPAV